MKKTLLLVLLIAALGAPAGLRAQQASQIEAGYQLPPTAIIDIHTHVWLDRFKAHKREKVRRAVTWPSLVAAENSIEDLEETYRLMFPGKRVTPLIFSSMKRSDDCEALNGYIAECAARRGAAVYHNRMRSSGAMYPGSPGPISNAL